MFSGIIETLGEITFLKKELNNLHITVKSTFANELKIDQSTGSKVTLSGKAGTLEVDGSTGSKFKGEDMNTTVSNVTVSTGAIVSVSAEKELQVKASTGGNVKYKGAPSIRDIKKSTGGSVTKI